MRRHLSRWWPALAMMVAIFIGSSIPGREFPVYQGVWDFIVKKSGHLLEYGLLAVLMLRAVEGGRAATGESGSDRPSRRALAAAFLIAAVYGLTDEFHQRFTPGRLGQPLDAALDAAGAGLGLALLYWGRLIRRTRSPARPPRSTRPSA